MLTGVLPFQAPNRKETLQQILKARLCMPQVYRSFILIITRNKN